MTPEEQLNSIEEASNSVAMFFQQYGVRLLLSVVLFIVFTKLIQVLINLLDEFLSKRKIEPKVGNLILGITRYILYVFLVLFLAAFLGIDISVIALLIIAAIVVIAVTMQSTLVNVGAGFVLSGIKIFKKGDYVLFNGMEGKVKKIDVYHTQIERPDNAVVFVPNSQVLTGVIVNTDRLTKRRVDIPVFVSFNNDIDKMRKLMLELTYKDKRVLDDPKPFVVLDTIGGYSLKMRLSIWIKSENYWDMLFEYNEKVISTFEKNGIKFPRRRAGKLDQ